MRFCTAEKPRGPRKVSHSRATSAHRHSNRCTNTDGRPLGRPPAAPSEEDAASSGSIAAPGSTGPRAPPRHRCQPRRRNRRPRPGRRHSGPMSAMDASRVGACRLARAASRRGEQPRQDRRARPAHPSPRRARTGAAERGAGRTGIERIRIGRRTTAGAPARLCGVPVASRLSPDPSAPLGCPSGSDELTSGWRPYLPTPYSRPRHRRLRYRPDTFWRSEASTFPRTPWPP